MDVEEEELYLSCNKMATPKHLLLTVALLLLTLVDLATPLEQCPDCGNQTVPYPLSTSSSCGDQSYKIRCDAGTLIFDTLNNSYPITSIVASAQRLVIEPSQLLSSTCVTSDHCLEQTRRRRHLRVAQPELVLQKNTVSIIQSGSD